MNSLEIGNSIKELRKKAGLTQKELANGICTQAQISNIEKGEQYPSSIVLYDICIKLGVDMNSIFNFKHNSKTNYVESVKKIIRKHIRNRDYESLSYIVNSEKKNPLFSNGENKQFLIWHDAICDYYILKDKEKSIGKLQNSLNITMGTIHHSHEVESEILNSIAIIFSEEENYENALSYYERALRAFSLTSVSANYQIEIRILYGLSKCLNKMENYEKSLEYSRKAKDLCVENETNYLLGEVLYQISQTLIKMGAIESGLKYLDRAIILFEVHDNYKFVEIMSIQKNNIQKNLLNIE